MNDLQACQLKILKAFINVCETHHLRYFLIGGSALGAIRHHGFIPWDDDIDVGMPRPDYEKLLKLKDPFQKTPYFLQTYRTDFNYLYNFAKIRDNNTTFIETPYAHHQINHGVWIDVFPLDGMSYKKDIAPKKLAYKVRLGWVAVYFMYLGSFWRKLSWRTLYLDLPLNLVSILFFWVNVGHWTNKMIDRFAKKIPYEKAMLVGNLFGINMKKEAMAKEIFGKGTPATFEGIKVNVPEKYEQYLTNLYGDWKNPPKIRKQKGHHGNKGFSLTQDFNSYRYQHRL